MSCRKFHLDHYNINIMIIITIIIVLNIHCIIVSVVSITSDQYIVSLQRVNKIILLNN